jgi:hypothetical protein
MASTGKSQPRRWTFAALAATVFTPLLAAGGCDSMSNTDKGLLGGMGIGALAGTLLTRGNPAGAIIGAAAGGIAGGVTGAAVDHAEAKADARAAAAAVAARGPLGLTEIAQMSRDGVSDANIIEQIRGTRSVYYLTAEQVSWLKQSGVHDVVILEMQRTPDYYAYRRPGYYYPPPGVVVYETYPPPPPPVAVGVGFRVRY